MRVSNNLHISAGLIQIVAVILAAVQLYVISTAITPEARIMWLSAQNLLGGLILADLGLSQVSQRFAGHSLSANANEYPIKQIFKKTRKYYLWQVLAIIFISIIQLNLGLEDHVNYLAHLTTIIIGFITLHKNRLGGILNNVKNPNLSRLVDVICTLLRIILIIIFKDNIQLVLLWWAILLLCQSAFYFWTIIPYADNDSEGVRSEVFDKNVLRTAVLNLGGFYITYLGGTLILKFTNVNLIDSYLLTHRILLIIFGVSQSFVYVSVPKYSQLYATGNFIDLKSLFLKSLSFSVLSYIGGVLFIFFVWNLLPVDANLLESRYFIIIALTYLLEIIHINLVTVTLSKPWQPYVKSVLIMICLFSLGYWVALMKSTFLLFLFVPLLVQIIASYPYSVYFYLTDSSWSLFSKNE